MSRAALQPSQQKLAEKLTILNDRGIGMLTRVYNIKKVGFHRCYVLWESGLSVFLFGLYYPGLRQTLL
uniref:Uncharacterized protein n=1 Tax=Paramormyrops kingsleyae TaxID=1676925 RepID=A0A3B3RR45_9TELE